MDSLTRQAGRRYRKPQWKYSGSNGFVTFTPTEFTGFTGQQLTFGQLTLTNTANGGAGTFGAQLGLTVNFTDPSAQSAVFADTLQLLAVSGNSGIDTLSLNYGGFPSVIPVHVRRCHIHRQLRRFLR